MNWFLELFNRRTFGAKRHKDWRNIRKEHLKKHPVCELTGSRKKLEIHHLFPVHLFPEKELDPDNLITLRKDVHLLFGHFNNYYKYNPMVEADIAIWKEKMK